MAFALLAIGALDALAQTANSPRVESTNPNLGVEFVSCTRNGSNVKIKILVTSNHEFTKGQFSDYDRIGYDIGSRREFIFQYAAYDDEGNSYKVKLDESSSYYHPGMPVMHYINIENVPKIVKTIDHVIGTYNVNNSGALKYDKSEGAVVFKDASKSSYKISIKNAQIK